MPQCFGPLTKAQLIIKQLAGWTVAAGPFPTMPECLASCLSSGAVSVVQNANNICADSTPLASFIISGTGFSSPYSSNSLILYDQVGNVIPQSITGGTSTTLDVQLTSPISTLGPITAVVNDGSGGTSGTPIQVGTAISCSGSSSSCPCDPLPPTLTLTLMNLTKCACANDITAIMTQGTGPSSNIWKATDVVVCGRTVNFTLTCGLIGGFPTYLLGVQVSGMEGEGVISMIAVCGPPINLSCPFGIPLTGVCSGTIIPTISS